MFCPSCGTESNGLNFCNRCGANLAALVAPVELAPISLTKPILIIGAVIALLTLGGFGVIISGTIEMVRNGAGGGGRIAIKYGSSAFAGMPAPGLYTNMQTMSSTVTAMGGYLTTTDGAEDGSVYIEKVSTGSMFMVR